MHTSQLELSRTRKGISWQKTGEEKHHFIVFDGKKAEQVYRDVVLTVASENPGLTWPLLVSVTNSRLKNRPELELPQADIFPLLSYFYLLNQLESQEDESLTHNAAWKNANGALQEWWEENGPGGSRDRSIEEQYNLTDDFVDTVAELVLQIKIDKTTGDDVVQVSSLEAQHLIIVAVNNLRERDNQQPSQEEVIAEIITIVGGTTL